MKFSFKYIFFISVFSYSCQTIKETSSNINDELESSNSNANSKAAAVYWQQNSAEYEALCYQAYNSAESYLKTFINGSDRNGNGIILKDDSGIKKAIILDLDETVLNNSTYWGYLVKNDLDYNYNSWLEWVKTASAELVPGARDFINNAIRLQVEVFFISNRFEQELEPTLQNMREKGIQFNQQNVFLRTSTPEKISRRELLVNAFDIIMLIGDNLADLHEVFESNILLDQRKEVVTSFSKEFGSKYIILPNTMYGGWEPTENSEDPNFEKPKKDLSPFIESFK